MITYKPFWETLKKSPETTYTLIHKHQLSSATIDRLRKDKPLSTITIDDLCHILNCPVFRRSTRKFPSFSSCHFFISFPASRFFLYLQQIFNALLGLFLLKKFF